MQQCPDAAGQRWYSRGLAGSPNQDAPWGNDSCVTELELLLEDLRRFAVHCRPPRGGRTAKQARQTDRQTGCDLLIKDTLAV